MSKVHNVFGFTTKGAKPGPNEDGLVVADSYTSDGSISVTQRGGFCVAVADGVGGDPGGAYAQRIALTALQVYGPPRDLSDLLQAAEAANQAVMFLGKLNWVYRNMATTLTWLWLFEEVAYVGHCGNTRLSVLQGDQYLVRTNDQCDAHGRLVGYLGVPDAPAAVPAIAFVMKASLISVSTIMLSSDGVHDFVSADKIREVLRSGATIDARAQSLISMARAGGSKDDLSVILVDFSHEEQ